MQPIRTSLHLDYPIEADGIDIDALQVRRPTAGDLLQASRHATDEEEREIVLFSWLAGVSRAAIEALDLADYRALQRLYASFTDPSSASGGNGATA